MSETTKNIKIGDKFNKRLNKGKTAECEIVDIIVRTSIITGENVGFEYWAKSLSKEYTAFGMFEVSETTVMRSRLNGL